MELAGGLRALGTPPGEMGGVYEDIAGKRHGGQRVHRRASARECPDRGRPDSRGGCVCRVGRGPGGGRWRAVPLPRVYRRAHPHREHHAAAGGVRTGVRRPWHHHGGDRPARDCKRVRDGGDRVHAARQRGAAADGVCHAALLRAGHPV